MAKRKELYSKAKKTYGDRSRVVHDDKLIDSVEDSIIKDAFDLARNSCQSILLDTQLLSLYSHEGTSDKKLRKGKGTIKKEAHEALEAFFLDLDLGSGR